MKPLLIIVLSLTLAGCGALAPVPPTPVPTSSPQVVLQTVMVTVVVTQFITLTPSKTPTATLTPIPTFTLTPQGTAPTALSGTVTAGASVTPQASAAATSASATATLPADAGGGLFTTLTRSTDHFGLNCQPDTVTFGVSTTNTDVTEVDLFYRMEDRASGAISDWVDIGKMTAAGAGNFTMDFTASMIDRDLRTHKAWLDYQFVGLGRGGAILGRSAKIVKQINYAPDCTG